MYRFSIDYSGKNAIILATLASQLYTYPSKELTSNVHPGTHPIHTILTKDFENLMAYI
jgi:hypothetical protein